MLLKQQLIMRIGETKNGFKLTKKMVLNSIYSFSSVPIIWNQNSNFKDYNDTNKYIETQTIIGFLLEEPNITIKGNNVYADIIIIDNITNYWNGRFDNWCIQFDENINDKFELFSIEVF